ncbi:hypothetical protein PRIPAC_82588 [Pristionchus pacificus]|uniref:G protein-coupled receptor n=1 Tax=Pristionchus pacificus TaxID=54126 RepID=A0A2A6CJY6_PRIPA|nr:hypothetical protein PRIPAC_82588 [Pristionchus pacificus]|eukprot:PDM78397.1 G protein-coupled receptor [Pristionchus pacificus]
MVIQIRFITETFVAPEYDCSAHSREEWTKLHGTKQLLLGIWSTVFPTICQIMYIPAIRVFYRERRLTCYKIMFLLAIADMGGLTCFGTLFGYSMIRGMVFCSNKTLAWIIGSVFWIISSCNCLLLVVNRIFQLWEKSWIFQVIFINISAFYLNFTQGTPSSLLMLATIVYGLFESLFTRPPVPNSSHQFCAFSPFIPGHSPDEYSNSPTMIHNICLATSLISVYIVLCALVRSKTALMIQQSSSAAALQAKIFTQATIVCFLFGASSTVWLVQEFLFVPPPSVHDHGPGSLPCIIYLVLNQAVRYEFRMMFGMRRLK